MPPDDKKTRVTGAESVKPGSVISNSIAMKLVRIPAGAFVMGTPDTEKHHRENEGPQHQVGISKPFFMGVHEVTQKEYESVMGKNPSFFKEVEGQDTDRFPVERVHFAEAVEFCEKLSARAGEVESRRAYRLPTEAEWEYACRSGTQTAVHFGDTLSSRQANFNGAHPYGPAGKIPPGPDLRRPCVVGSYKPNAFGLYDMHGNVAEFVSDWYEKDYYAKSAAVDPEGPATGDLRLLRGGGWKAVGNFCRSGARYFERPDRTYEDHGFRVVCTIKP
jgi:formylglycine-generating enzyme required for sulfatase activity